MQRRQHLGDNANQPFQGGHSADVILPYLRHAISSPTPSRNTLEVPPAHKQSVPVNLQPYVHEAMETASDHIGRTANLRKISLVKVRRAINTD